MFQEHYDINLLNTGQSDSGKEARLLLSGTFLKIRTLCRLVLILLSAILYNQCKRPDKMMIRDIDGNIYRTVQIGRQRWMSENLKTSRYNDGSEIPLAEAQDNWGLLKSDAYCVYKNNECYADTFGFLYNWYAVSSGKLCPVGWHVPADHEWMYLEGIVDTRYGVGDSVWQKVGLRGYDVGQGLKSGRGWRAGITGTSKYGFSALPGGERLHRFYACGSSGFWWSSTETGSSGAYYRNLIYSFNQIARDTHPKNMGFSVRCLQDN